MREALFYKVLEGDKVQCELCPRECIIPKGGRGFCRVRQHVNGQLRTENYLRCSSYALDPIEKKPLYHFHPGSTIFSIGTWGCNFTCQFCQNWQIAQAEPETVTLTPDKVLEIVKEHEHKDRCIGVAYTYSEPTVWYEFVLETAEKVQTAGFKNVLVTNGYIAEKPLQQLLPLIDAMNIDIKAFHPDFYRQVCCGELEYVKRTAEIAARHCHVELTTLLIPGMNDSTEEIERLVDWVATKLHPGVPLHFSRYFPSYKLKASATPVETLERARDIAKRRLRYVYLGNVGSTNVNTYCYQCGALVIDRRNGEKHVTDEQKCPECGAPIEIVK
jgi:pyruvate formate lyase activating enzyme